MAMLHEKKGQIYEAIDRGGWYHSRHLPRDEHGYTKWGAETARKVKAILESEVQRAVRIAGEAQSLIDAIDWDSYQEDDS